MDKKDKALILVNTGTPEKPELKHVRRFLKEFLNDKFVIDIPWIFRKILVNFIIVPFRAPKSTKLYNKLWTKKGSPLLIHLNDLVYKLNADPESDYEVFGAMRYGKPSLKRVLNKVKKSYSDITILPLFPQYASSTTGSIEHLATRLFNQEKRSVKINIIKQFYNHPAFIKAFIGQIKNYNPESFEAIVFSYHGLPIRQINKIHPKQPEHTCNCTVTLPDHGLFCYKATCYHTTRLFIDELNLPDEKCYTTFQSRLSKNWLKPFTDDHLIQLAKKGIKKILIIAPSFVADCLETTVELGIEYKEILNEYPDVQLEFVESLNSSHQWADAITKIIQNKH